MFKIAEGVYTDSAFLADEARREADEAAKIAAWRDAYEASWPRWDPVEGKWDL